MYVRPEHDQWSFVEARSRAYDGAIVAAKHLAPYPPGHQSFGKPADRLARAVLAAQRTLVVDPGTPQLSSRAVTRYASAARLRATGGAGVVSLPATPATVVNTVIRDRFVDAVMDDQRLASEVAPPYFEPRSRQDAAHRRNMQMLRRVISVQGVQRPVAFLQVTRARLIAGLVTELARDYAATGVERVYLRVRGGGEQADAAGMRAWLAAVDAFMTLGVELFPDCVGRLGPVLVHAGAAGFSTGTMFFRSAPQALLSRDGGGGGQAVSVESHRGWREVERESAEAAALGPCPMPSCPVGRAADPSLDDLREHRLHTLDRLAREAVVQDTTTLIRSLRASAQPRAGVWADVLAERARRIA
ncbi:hypothetical protein [Baekduia sp. Peel2402]|uniref:hypothetical protein n=1 Tax=Baekduia sp. Peel2402 TaxID=3458296 RepID=UPI00403E6392